MYSTAACYSRKGSLSVSLGYSTAACYSGKGGLSVSLGYSTAVCYLGKGSLSVSLGYSTAVCHSGKGSLPTRLPAGRSTLKHFSAPTARSLWLTSPSVFPFYPKWVEKGSSILARSSAVWSLGSGSFKARCDFGIAHDKSLQPYTLLSLYVYVNAYLAK